MVEQIRVLVADDHAAVRTGLANILGAEPDITIIGEASDGLEAIKKARELKPGIIFMDIFMPLCNGLEACATIRQELPDTRVLVLTVSESEVDLFQALRLGAQGYLLKSATVTEVVDAVRRIAAGEAMLSASMITKLVTELRANSDEPKLSAREVEVLQLLGDGLTNIEIADQLFISESTVRTYLHRLLEKLQLKNRAQATAYAIRHHLRSMPF
jgi:two-component system NarL family response regulator